MIDWHSHILPGMDDGSRDVTESLCLINMQMAQGVRTVIATPHFYADDETVASFLDRREKAFELLKTKLPAGVPDIKLGAEVRYYQGISRMENINSLRIEGSNLLLLEMPMISWSEYILGELRELAGKSHIILAHIERYMNLQSRTVLKKIIESDILMQANAEFFISFPSRYKAISFLKKGNILLIGSDCHDINLRYPQLEKAFNVIRKKFGDDYIEQMKKYGESLLSTVI